MLNWYLHEHNDNIFVVSHKTTSLGKKICWLPVTSPFSNNAFKGLNSTLHQNFRLHQIHNICRRQIKSGSNGVISLNRVENIV